MTSTIAAPRVAGPGDIDTIADIVADSFEHLDVIHFLVPDASRRRAVTRDWYRLYVAHAIGGAGQVVMTEDGNAAAVWFDRTIEPTEPEGYDKHLPGSDGLTWPHPDGFNWPHPRYEASRALVTASSSRGASRLPRSRTLNYRRVAAQVVVCCQDLGVDDDMMRQAEADGRHVAEAVDALGAWLLTEDAYERSGVPDEVLTYMQDHIDRLLGPHATLIANDFLRQHVEAGGDLANLARDRSALLDLLALVEGKRHRGFELEWRADRPAPPEGEAHFHADDDRTPRSR